ncbi:MAG: hypothetical protein J0H89_02230 [Rhizobiales bacterium]|jgi:hypothetical protein|nr:hypothetical protein [Hyphomicrobiales bacterium]
MPKTYKVELQVNVTAALCLHGEAHKGSRKKRWFYRFWAGLYPQKSNPGRLARIDRSMKRVGFGDRYSEKVIDHHTGEIIHECHEPLSVHTGHGSAKTESKNNE